VSKPVEFRRRALSDVRKAARWYDSHRPGLGAEFEADIDACLERLEEKARLFRPYYQELHRLALNRFPYKIFYVVELFRSR
jgi:plasmid stabilization system protein ParE